MRSLVRQPCHSHRTVVHVREALVIHVQVAMDQGGGLHSIYDVLKASLVGIGTPDIIRGPQGRWRREWWMLNRPGTVMRDHDIGLARPGSEDGLIRTDLFLWPPVEPLGAERLIYAHASA